MDATTFLGIERIDEGHWRLDVVERLITPGQFLFGGCGLAAGLVALEAESGRPTIWATAHYLSYAPTHSSVDVYTDLVVQGGNVTQARATAKIGNKEILTVTAALGRGSLSSDEPWCTMPTVPAPDDCPPRIIPKELGESVFAHIDTRVALGRTFEQLDGTPGSPHSALWARIPSHLEPSAATLAIFGDYVSGGAANPLGKRTMGRSLDNTIRVAQLVPTEWILCDIQMHALYGGFSQGAAYLYSESGTLLGVASQSIATKVWEPPSR